MRMVCRATFDGAWPARSARSSPAPHEGKFVLFVLAAATLGYARRAVRLRFGAGSCGYCYLCQAKSMGSSRPLRGRHMLVDKLKVNDVVGGARNGNN